MVELEGRMVHPYVSFVVGADPIEGTSLGVDEAASRLGEVSPEAIEGHVGELRGWLQRTEARPPGAPGSEEWFERELLIGELRSRIGREEHQRAWARAPYWYAERCGEALSSLLTARAAPTDGRDGSMGEAVLDRLRALPGYVRQGIANLDPAEVPPLWAHLGVTAAIGLGEFLARDLASYAATQPEPLHAALDDALGPARDAVDELAETSRRLSSEGRGSWVAGEAYVAGQLTWLHRLDLTPSSLLALGHELIEETDRALSEAANDRDPKATWLEQLDSLKDRHPDGADFVDTYAQATAATRRWVLDNDLVTVPDGEECHVDWVPEFLRASLPLGCMETVKPYGSVMESQFLITPLDPDAPEERREQHRRDNCYAFVESIAGHETYPGHHLQSVHHVLGTAPDSIARYVRSPLFIEGWGLYVEDLLEESGAVSPEVILFARRNALWRALRVVVDMGLHTGQLSVDDAVELLCTRAGMGRHMATGEVHRYTRHDNPTYPSSYLLGRRELHRLRDRWRRERSSSSERATLRAFHDAVLAHGSPPFALLEPVLFAAAPGEASEAR